MQASSMSALQWLHHDQYAQVIESEILILPVYAMLLPLMVVV
jgi:hypothetical protein